jgi:hypothetical protein
MMEMDSLDFEHAVLRIASALEAQNMELRRIAKALEEMLEKGVITHASEL